MRPGLAILAAAILALPARALAAEQEPNRVAFRLEYTPRPGCIDRETFVDDWLAGEFGDAVVFDDARAFVRVAVKRNGPRPEAHVSAFDEKGVEHWHIVIPTRVDCRELMQDVAYSMATNLGKWDLKKQPVPAWLLRWAPLPEVGTPAPSPPPRAFVAMLPPAPRLVRRPVLAQVPASDPQAKQADGPRWELGASAFVAPYGLLGVGLGGGLSLSGRWHAFSIAAELRGLSTTEFALAGVQTRTTMWFGLVAPCFDTRLYVVVCGLGSVGRIGYSAAPSLQQSDPTALAIMIGARLGGRWRASDRIVIEGFGEAMVPLGASQFQVKQANNISNSQSLGAVMLTAGLAVAFDVSNGGKP